MFALESTEPAAMSAPADGARPAAVLARNSLYVWTGSAGGPAMAGQEDGRAREPDSGLVPGAIPLTARAVIGDDLRRPRLWCELGACVSRFSDGSALGERDNHRRAFAAGWRQDAFGCWLCPGCLDRHPYWNARPLRPSPHRR